MIPSRRGGGYRYWEGGAGHGNNGDGRVWVIKGALFSPVRGIAREDFGQIIELWVMFGVMQGWWECARGCKLRLQSGAMVTSLLK